jgi:hypothetical protein
MVWMSQRAPGRRFQYQVQCHGAETGLAQTMEKIKAGKSGADDRDIDLLRAAV